MARHEVRTRTGRLLVEHDGDRFEVTASGHVGPQLVRRDLQLAEAYGTEHPGGWWYVVDTGGVRLPNPLNVVYLRRIRRLPNLRGYVVIAPGAVIGFVARVLGAVSRPDAVVRSRETAARFITTRGDPEAAPMFLYDGDCGFCRRWAAWLAHRSRLDRFLPYQSLADLGSLGLAAEQLERASCLVDEEGRSHFGAAGFAETFKRSGGLWPLAGHLLAAPGLRVVAAAVYTLVSSNRHRLPAPGGEIDREPGARSGE